MIYVFEDDSRDSIPQLFMKSYDENVSSQFIYTKGNGNIYNKVERKIRNIANIMKDSAS